MTPLDGLRRLGLLDANGRRDRTGRRSGGVEHWYADGVRIRVAREIGAGQHDRYRATVDQRRGEAKKQLAVAPV